MRLKAVPSAEREDCVLSTDTGPDRASVPFACPKPPFPIFPPKSILNRSSGLRSPWNPPVEKPGCIPPPRLDIPPPRCVGSACGFESYAARMFVSESTWKAFETTARSQHAFRGVRRDELLNASSAPGAPLRDVSVPWP